MCSSDLKVDRVGDAGEGGVVVVAARLAHRPAPRTEADVLRVHGEVARLLVESNADPDKAMHSGARPFSP